MVAILLHHYSLLLSTPQSVLLSPWVLFFNIYLNAANLQTVKDTKIHARALLARYLCLEGQRLFYTLNTADTHCSCRAQQEHFLSHRSVCLFQFEFQQQNQFPIESVLHYIPTLRGIVRLQVQRIWQRNYVFLTEAKCMQTHWLNILLVLLVYLIYTNDWINLSNFMENLLLLKDLLFFSQ